MRVLITGAHGLLGSTLAPHVASKGHTVATCSRTQGDVRADLAVRAEVDAALDVAKPDVLINLVAHTNVDDCERDPQLAYRANVRVVENLANWVGRQHGAAHLIQISTDQLYDGPGPHQEDEITLRNYYGFSKYAGELAAAGGTVLRTNFFGRSERAGRTSLSDWVVGALRRGEAITVFDDVYFSPLGIRRLVDVLAMLVDDRRAGVFNLGSRDGMSKADFAFALADDLGLSTSAVRRGKSTDVSFAARRPGDMRMDSTRFEQTFGITLPTLREEISSLATEYARES